MQQHCILSVDLAFVKANTCNIQARAVASELAQCAKAPKTGFA